MAARSLVALIALALTALPAARADQPVPPLSSPVTDVAGLLSAEQAAGLDAKLRLPAKRFAG